VIKYYQYKQGSIFKIEDCNVYTYMSDCKSWFLTSVNREDLVRWLRLTQLTLLDLDMLGVVK